MVVANCWLRLITATFGAFVFASCTTNFTILSMTHNGIVCTYLPNLFKAWHGVCVSKIRRKKGFRIALFEFVQRHGRSGRTLRFELLIEAMPIAAKVCSVLGLGTKNIVSAHTRVARKTRWYSVVFVLLVR